MPDLHDLVPATTVTALPERDLDATYYDTADLRLARSGITMRHRSGEPGPAWTVKLPEADQAPALARREIGFTGPPEHIPDQAADLVLATTRGQYLAPVARLTTARLPTEIRDRDGHLLAEVVDDTVTVSQPERPTDHFREVEVEVPADTPAGRRLLRAAVARLVDAGSVAQPPMPKLVRALGERATQPPDVVVAPLKAHATVTDLIRHTVASGLDRILRHDPGVRLGDDPEDVHQLRVATRQLRSDLRTFKRLLGPDQVDAVRDELGWLADLVGKVRDTDVLAARLRANSQTLADIDASAVAELLSRLDTEAGAARIAMLEAMRSPRYLRLLDALAAFAADPTVIDKAAHPDRTAASVATDLVRRPWRDLAKAVAALGADPPDTALHQVRILAKRSRYAAEAVAPVVGKPAARFAAAVADLQTVLGEHQDAVVAQTWLRDAATAQPATGLAAGQLIAIERA
jgi:CHAD domain-containing protein